MYPLSLFLFLSQASAGAAACAILRKQNAQADLSGSKRNLILCCLFHGSLPFLSEVFSEGDPFIIRYIFKQGVIPWNF